MANERPISSGSVYPSPKSREFKPTHYVHMNSGGAIFVKDADLFAAQGGHDSTWGTAWTGIVARNYGDAYQKAEVYYLSSAKEIPGIKSNSTQLTPSPQSRTEKVARVMSVLGISSVGHASSEELADMIVTALDEPSVLVEDLPDHMVLKSDGLFRLGDDAMKWAEAFVRTVKRRDFETPNLWDEGYMVGWFANAIEATKMLLSRDHESKDKESFRRGYDAGLDDGRGKSAWQDWVLTLSIMQQSVLASAVRAPDGMRKFHPAKMLVRWYRRSVLVSAFDGKPLLDPHAPGGGSFTGPLTSDYSVEQMADEFLLARDEMSLHYYAHMMHAAQIIGCYHPDDFVRDFWDALYKRMVNALHLNTESYSQMARRLSDSPEAWAERSDEAGSCTD